VRQFVWFLTLAITTGCGQSGTSAAGGDDAGDGKSGVTDATALDSAADATAAAGTDAFSDAALDADSASGTDATATACAPTYTGSIPGAQLDLSMTPCKFSISAAKGVFNLPYGLTISSANTLSMDGTAGGCQPPVSSFHGGIAAAEHVSGGGQSWCLCDVGLCAPTGSPFAATVPGDYATNFAWDGNNWNGPSDTGNKPGPAFPLGSYLFTVTVSGKHQAPDGATQPFSAAASLTIVLSP